MTRTREYEIVIRQAPRSMNAGGGGARLHPYIAAKQKREWEQLLLAEFMVAKVEPFMSFCAVDVTVHFKRRNHRDEENFRPGVIKALGDALQQGQFLMDDTRSFFRVSGFRLVEASEPWPQWAQWLKGYTVINMEASYA